MFNLYQNLNKRDDDHKESDVTGHDRFWQERPKTRRKRRAINRRTQSAIELDSEAIVSARSTLRRRRSASIKDEDSDEEKSYQLTNKIDNLAKILFNRVSAARSYKDSDVRYVHFITILSLLCIIFYISYIIEKINNYSNNTIIIHNIHNIITASMHSYTIFPVILASCKFLCSYFLF